MGPCSSRVRVLAPQSKMINSQITTCQAANEGLLVPRCVSLAALYHLVQINSKITDACRDLGDQTGHQKQIPSCQTPYLSLHSDVYRHYSATGWYSIATAIPAIKITSKEGTWNLHDHLANLPSGRTMKPWWANLAMTVGGSVQGREPVA